MEKKYSLGIFTLLIVGILGVNFVMAFPMGFGSSMGFGGFFNEELTAEDLEVLTEERQQMTEAIENGNYDAWKALMEERIERMKAELTEENFNQIVERYNQMEERKQLREQIREAWESGDYEAVVELREELTSSGGFGCPKAGFRGHHMLW
jgi:hypothetical protein